MWLIFTGNLRPARHGLSCTSFTHVAASPQQQGHLGTKLRKPDDGGERAPHAAEARGSSTASGHLPRKQQEGQQPRP